MEYKVRYHLETDIQCDPAGEIPGQLTEETLDEIIQRIARRVFDADGVFSRVVPRRVERPGTAYIAIEVRRPDWTPQRVYVRLEEVRVNQ